MSWPLIVLIVLAGILALALFLLWVPVGLALRAECYGRPKMRVRTSWLFGLVKREPKPRKREARPRKEKARRRLKEIVRDLRTLLAMLRTKGVPRQILRLLKDSIRVIRFRQLSVDLKLGLGNPADTAILFGIIGPIALFLGRPPTRQIKVSPVFLGAPTCEGYLEGAFRFRPIRLVPPMTRFLLSRPVRRLIIVAIRGRWKRK